MTTALTLDRFYVGIGVGKLRRDAQGTAIGAGLNAGGLEEQWFPVGSVSEAHHLFSALQPAPPFTVMLEGYKWQGECECAFQFALFLIFTNQI